MAKKFNKPDGIYRDPVTGKRILVKNGWGEVVSSPEPSVTADTPVSAAEEKNVRDAYLRESAEGPLGATAAMLNSGTFGLAGNLAEAFAKDPQLIKDYLSEAEAQHYWKSLGAAVVPGALSMGATAPAAAARLLPAMLTSAAAGASHAESVGGDPVLGGGIAAAVPVGIKGAGALLGKGKGLLGRIAELAKSGRLGPERVPAPPAVAPSVAPAAPPPALPPVSTSASSSGPWVSAVSHIAKGKKTPPAPGFMVDALKEAPNVPKLQPGGVSTVRGAKGAIIKNTSSTGPNMPIKYSRVRGGGPPGSGAGEPVAPPVAPLDALDEQELLDAVVQAAKRGSRDANKFLVERLRGAPEAPLPPPAPPAPVVPSAPFDPTFLPKAGPVLIPIPKLRGKPGTYSGRVPTPPAEPLPAAPAVAPPAAPAVAPPAAPAVAPEVAPPVAAPAAPAVAPPAAMDNVDWLGKVREYLGNTMGYPAEYGIRNYINMQSAEDRAIAREKKGIPK